MPGANNPEAKYEHQINTNKTQKHTPPLFLARRSPKRPEVCPQLHHGQPDQKAHRSPLHQLQSTGHSCRLPPCPMAVRGTQLCMALSALCRAKMTLLLQNLYPLNGLKS